MAALRGQQPALGPTSPIPDKLYFKIGEVAKLVGVQAHVLRYWQSEVPAIRPSKSSSNQRRYRYKDVEIFREIKRLLYEERYTLAGARRRILAGDTGGAVVASAFEGQRFDDAPAAVGTLGASAKSGGNAYGGASSPPPLGALGAHPPHRERARDHLEADHDELFERLRRGLKDLIRLAGEEP